MPPFRLPRRYHAHANDSGYSPGECPVSLVQAFDDDADRSQWPAHFRRVVEYFESVSNSDEWDAGDRYRDTGDPYVLHAKVRAPAHPEDDKERPWNILFNPYVSPADRDAWVMDGRPLLPSQTAHGAPDDVDDPLIAADRDIEAVEAGRVVICLALTRVAGIHSRGGTWVLSDDRIETQFDTVLDMLDESHFTDHSRFEYDHQERARK